MSASSTYGAATRGLRSRLSRLCACCVVPSPPRAVVAVPLRSARQDELRRATSSPLRRRAPDPSADSETAATPRDVRSATAPPQRRARRHPRRRRPSRRGAVRGGETRVAEDVCLRPRQTPPSSSGSHSRDGGAVRTLLPRDDRVERRERDPRGLERRGRAPATPVRRLRASQPSSRSRRQPLPFLVGRAGAPRCRRWGSNPHALAGTGF
jgi:hypothetical protein